MIEAIAAGLVLAVAAPSGAVWYSRRQRAKFVATLTDEDRARLEGFEERGSWTLFRELLELERQQAATIRPPLEDLQDTVNRDAA